MDGHIYAVLLLLSAIMMHEHVPNATNKTALCSSIPAPFFIHVPTRMRSV